MWVCRERRGLICRGRGRTLSLSHDSPSPSSTSSSPSPLIQTLPFLPPASPLLTPFPPSPRRQGWIPAFISTIQPRCLLATEHGSFNCPPPPSLPPPSSCILLFYPRSYIQRANRLYSHGFSACVFTSRAPESKTSEPGLFPLCCSTCLPGLEHSNCISATLEARQTGRRGCSVRTCHRRIQQVHETHTNTQSMGEDRTWPPSL